MNSTTKTFPRRSQAEPWRGVIEHHRRPLAERVARLIQTTAVLGAFAFIGILLAYRG